MLWSMCSLVSCFETLWRWHFLISKFFMDDFIHHQLWKIKFHCYVTKFALIIILNLLLMNRDTLQKALLQIYLSFFEHIAPDQYLLPVHDIFVMYSNKVMVSLYWIFALDIQISYTTLHIYTCPVFYGVNHFCCDVISVCAHC